MPTKLGQLAITACLVMAATTFAAQPQPNQRLHAGRYLGHSIVRVNLNSNEQLDFLRQTGAEILDCVPGPGPMTALASEVQIDLLRQSGLEVAILNNDVQGTVERERQPIARLDPFADYFLDYHQYTTDTGGILWYLNELADRYPALASVITVGTTLEGRTIYALRIANDEEPGPKPAVLYFGTEHAREWITTTITPYFATHLLENYATDSLATDLVDHVEFFLIPVFNVDGYVYSWSDNRFWRKNRRNNGSGIFGVDLNRNWSEGWGGPGSSGNTSSETYRGTAPFSEPETQVLRDFILAHPNIRAQFDIHSFSQLILWPFGYTDQNAYFEDRYYYEENAAAMQSMIEAVHGLEYQMGHVYVGIYPASGISLDWTYAQRGILSYSFECRDTGVSGFALPPEQIIPNNEELLPALLHVANSDWVRRVIRFNWFPAEPASVIVQAGVDKPFVVEFVSQTENYLPDSPTFYYRMHPEAPFEQVPMTHMTGDFYLAYLPATNCWSTPQFYFTVTGDGGTTEVSPHNAPAGSIFTAQVTIPFSECTTARGDYNGDSQINLTDFAAFPECLAGPNAPTPPACEVFDFTEDNHIALDDYAAMQRTF